MSVDHTITREGSSGARHGLQSQKVGPNAIIQLTAVLREGWGEHVADACLASANLLSYRTAPPGGMIDEREVVTLFASVRLVLGGEQADIALMHAGFRTGDYILANRIPRGAQRALRLLPAPLAARALLHAIARNAWTFAGSGNVELRTALNPALSIAGNPLATPGCPWHVGVLTRLFRSLASPRAVLTHTSCCARGDRTCRTGLALP